MTTLRKDEGAAAAVIGFAIAGVIFLTAVGLLMVLARGSIPPGQASDADPAGRIQAESALALLLTEGTSSGGSAGWDDTPGPSQTWVHDANAPGVPGLLEPDSRHLDPLKLANLLRASGGGRLEPDELRIGLGLTTANGVHLRVTPLLAPLEEGAPALDFTVCYVGGPDATLAAAELAMLRSLVKTPGNATAAAGFTGCAAPPDVLVYGTDHADAGAADAFSIATAVQGGMTLVLLGSPTPCSTCLADLVAAAPPASPCAPLAVDDPSHPVTTTPNLLGASGYAPYGAMPGLGAADGAFEVAAGSLPAPILAASLCGSLGAGQVLVARVSPTALYGAASGTTVEGTRLLHNLLVRHAQAMSFDFGGTLPGGPLLAPAQAVVPGAVVWDGSRVPVRVALWVF